LPIGPNCAKRPQRSKKPRPCGICFLPSEERRTARDQTLFPASVFRAVSCLTQAGICRFLDRWCICVFVVADCDFVCYHPHTPNDHRHRYLESVGLRLAAPDGAMQIWEVARDNQGSTSDKERGNKATCEKRIQKIKKPKVKKNKENGLEGQEMRGGWILSMDLVGRIWIDRSPGPDLFIEPASVLGSCCDFIYDTGMSHHRERRRVSFRQVLPWGSCHGDAAVGDDVRLATRSREASKHHKKDHRRWRQRHDVQRARIITRDEHTRSLTNWVRIN
jgi:hypothetical protein